jgi:DNA-binding transcriptional LysR family regulator
MVIHSFRHSVRWMVWASVTDMRRAVDDVTGLIRGRIAVGMVTACMVTPLFDALAAFHSAHPGVEIALSEHSGQPQAYLADVCAHPIVCLPIGTGIRTVFGRRLLGGRHSADRAAGSGASGRC